MNKDKLLKFMDEIPFFKEMDESDRENLLSHKTHWVHFKPRKEFLKRMKWITDFL